MTSFRSKLPDKKEQVLSPQFRLATAAGFVPSPLNIKAILTASPYPIRAMLIQGGNPLLSYANARETFEALQKLDFLAAIPEDRNLLMTAREGIPIWSLPPDSAGFEAVSQMMTKLDLGRERT